MGTSLYVQSFASLPNYVGKECKRVLINRERVGKFKFNDPTNKTDVFYKVSSEPFTCPATEAWTRPSSVDLSYFSG